MDRLFYTKMNLCALGVKVTNLQGPAEKGCASMPRSPLAEDDLVGFGADQHLTGFIPQQLLSETKRALICKVYGFIIVSLNRMNKLLHKMLQIQRTRRPSLNRPARSQGLCYIINSVQQTVEGICF